MTRARLCVVLDCDDGTEVLLTIAEARKLGPRLTELADSVWEDEPEAEPDTGDDH